jgi:hypothetical protein
VARARYAELSAARRQLKLDWACSTVNPRRACGCEQHAEFARLEAEAERTAESTGVTPLMLLLAERHPDTFAPQRP